jgi:hypothetical protein
MTVSIERASDLLSERRSRQALEGTGAQKAAAKRTISQAAKKAASAGKGGTTAKPAKKAAARKAGATAKPVKKTAAGASKRPTVRRGASKQIREAMIAEGRHPDAVSVGSDT